MNEFGNFAGSIFDNASLKQIDLNINTSLRYEELKQVHDNKFVRLIANDAAGNVIADVQTYFLNLIELLNIWQKNKTIDNVTIKLAAYGWPC